MHRILVFSDDVTVGITLATKLVKSICEERDIKTSTCRPCGHIKFLSWREMDRVQNPRFLMHLSGCVYPFDGVPFDVFFAHFGTWPLVVRPRCSFAYEQRWRSHKP